MTDQLAHRDLRNRSAEILRDGSAGASYEITNHGEVVALLTPPAPDGRVREAPRGRGRVGGACPYLDEDSRRPRRRLQHAARD